MVIFKNLTWIQQLNLTCWSYVNWITLVIIIIGRYIINIIIKHLNRTNKYKYNSNKYLKI